MIKKLRTKFVIISMISILIVLSVIMAGINISNFQTISNNTDVILDNLYKNGGKFNRNFNPENTNQNNFNPKETSEADDLNEFDEADEELDKRNPEMMFETRYFTVKIAIDSNNNKTYTVFKDNIRAVETEEAAINYANKAINYSSKRGYIGNYRFLYGTDIETDTTTVIFVDCTRSLENARSFLFSSLLISLIGYLCVFVLILVASKYVFKPVDDAYQKQKRFISNASHELKTPLTIISTNNELIEMINGKDESTEAINRQVIRLNQMVNSLALLTKLSETKRIENMKEFDLSKTINDVIDDSYILNDESKKIEVDIKDNLIYKGEEGLIKQLMSIVIDNAIKYSEKNVTIHTYQDGKNIIFECINDCYEIEDGIHNEVFERFYRNDNIRGKKDGSGIGLSIAKEITDLHNISITASSVNNQFKIKIVF